VATALDTGDGDLHALGMVEIYNQAGVDTDGNGKYDFLEIRTWVQIVDDPGNYQLEGWLVDEQGNLVSWAHAGPVPLSIGTHELTLTYDGRALADHMKEHSQGAQRFTLVAHK